MQQKISQQNNKPTKLDLIICGHWITCAHNVRNTPAAQFHKYLIVDI